MYCDVMLVRLHLRPVREIAVASDTPSESLLEDESTVRRLRCPACGVSLQCSDGNYPKQQDLHQLDG